MSEFRTIDLQPGGKEIALGGVADSDTTGRPNGLLSCEMDANFKNELIAEDKSDDNINNFIETMWGKSSVIADYVIEQDVSGIWFYRKWNSGLAECWGKYTYTSSTSSVWVTPLYVGDLVPALPYPFAFAETPNEWVSVDTSVNACWLYKEAGGHNTHLQTAAYRTIKVNGFNENIFEIHYYVVGKWGGEIETDE